MDILAKDVRLEGCYKSPHSMLQQLPKELEDRITTLHAGSHLKLNVVPHQKYNAWIGTAALSKLSTFQQVIFSSFFSCSLSLSLSLYLAHTIHLSK